MSEALPEVPIRVFLLIENRLLRDVLERLFRKRLDLQVVGCCEPGAGGRETLSNTPCDVVVLDFIGTDWAYANLEFKKQAAELVLQRLKDGLDRGDVDPKLLDDLGWTPDDMRRFVDRMSQSLHQTDAAETPEALARRVQFEEMLRSLNLDRTGTKRTAGQQPNREVDQIESRRAPVPSQYRKAWEKYTQQLSKQPTTARKTP